MGALLVGWGLLLLLLGYSGQGDFLILCEVLEYWIKLGWAVDPVRAWTGALAAEVEEQILTGLCVIHNLWLRISRTDPSHLEDVEDELTGWNRDAEEAMRREVYC